MTLLSNVHRSLRSAAARSSIVGLGVVASLAVAPAAASAASWSGAGALPAGAGAREPVVAASPEAAGAAAAWVENNRIVTSTIGGTGGWSSALPVSPDNGAYVTTPTLGYGTKGRLVVAWTQVENFHQRVAVAVRLTSGAWSPAAFVSDAGLDTRQVHVVVGQGGRADLAWVQSGMEGIAVIGTASAWIGTSAPKWKSGAVDGSSSNSDIPTLSLAVGRGGNDSVRAAWDDSRDPDSVVHTASHTATGPWGTTTTFEAGSQPRVAVDNKGRSAVTFVTPTGITIKRRSPTEWPWRTATVRGSEQFRTDLATQFVTDVSLAVESSGAVRVYFLQSHFQGQTAAYNVQRTTLPLSGTPFADTLSKNARSQHLSPTAAIDDVGNDVAYWNEVRPNAFQATLTSAGSLAGPSINNPAQSPPKVDAAGNGNAIVAWVTNSGLAAAVRR